MRDFTGRTANGLDDDALLDWMTAAPGRLGDLTLGDGLERDAWFGDDDWPDRPRDLVDGWASLADHHGYAAVEDGKITSLYYELRTLTPKPKAFSPEPPPNPRPQAFWMKLIERLTAVAGKPTKRTKNRVVFTWEGGEIAALRETRTKKPWKIIAIGILARGQAPI